MYIIRLRITNEAIRAYKSVKKRKAINYYYYYYYKRRQTLLRAVRKQQEEQNQVSGKQSPDECTVKIGRRSICITDKVTENRSEIRQVYSCRLALQFKS